MSNPKTKFLSPYAALVAVYFFLAGATAINIGVHEIGISHLIDQIAAKQDLTSVTAMDVDLNVTHLNFFAHLILKAVDPQKSTVKAALQNQQNILTLIKDLKKEFLASFDASLALVGLTLFFLVASTAGAESGPALNQRKIYSLLSISLVFFALGILCPVLTAVVKGQHDLVGGFIIQTSSKGIVSTVLTLFKSGNWIIAFLLTSFSIGIPIFKGIATVIACLGRSDQKRLKTARILEAVGKWSLTDVMVAAVLLGCFSLNALREDSGGIVAVPRFALGFFILYCILAARTAYLLKSAVRSPREKTASTGNLPVAIFLASSLAAGAVAGYFTFANFSYGRELGDLMIVKLVRAHTELYEAKSALGPSGPVTIPFETPFKGKLTVTVTPHDKTPLNVEIFRGEPDAAATAKRSVVQLATIIDLKKKSYELTGRIPAGKYDLNIAAKFPDAGLQIDTVSVHITLDP